MALSVSIGRSTSKFDVAGELPFNWLTLLKLEEESMIGSIDESFKFSLTGK